VFRFLAFAVAAATWVGAPPAQAEQAPVWVWYRTSAGCPTGDTFVARLSELGHAARLAKVGDRVDFVVTLGSDAEKSSGRLERQTRQGTVAIRDYEDARCDQVAEALALTLELALDPGTAATPGAPAPLPTGAAGASADVAPSGGAPGEAVARHGAEAAQLSIGAQVSALAGTGPGLLPGAALFVELVEPLWPITSVRAGLRGVHGSGDARGHAIETTWIGGRAEGCRSLWNTAEVSVAPCAGFELGALRAESAGALGTAATGVWAAAVAHGRVSLRIGPRLRLEAELGASVPFVHYALGTVDGRATWFRTAALVPEASGGAAFEIW
jgi:hypothetical protein